MPGASLRPPLAFNLRPLRLSTPTDAFQLHHGTTLSAKAEARGRERERERAAARAVAEGSPLPSVDNPRPSVDDLELAKAIFSDDRLAAFEAALEAKFKASGGYDSDLSPPVKVRYISHWSPYDRVRVVNADP